MLLKWNENIKAIIATLLAIFIWGGLPSIVKIALSDLSISSFMVIRFFFASLFLLPFLNSIIRNCRKVSLPLWGASFLIIGTMFSSQTLAISLLPVSYYIIIFSINPVIIALFFRYRFQWQSIIGIGVVTISLFLFLTSSSHETQSLNILSFLIVSIGMISWVFYSVLIKKLQSTYNDMQITALTCYIGAIINGIFLFFHSNRVMEWQPHAIFLSGTAGIVSVFAFFCYSYGMRYQPKFCIFGQYLEPVLGLVIAAVLVGDHLSLLQLISGLLVLTGILVTTRYSKSINS